MMMSEAGGNLGNRSSLSHMLQILASTLPRAQPYCQQSPRHKCAGRIEPPLGMPIQRAKATLAARRIAVCVRLIHGKTALIQIDDRAAIKLMIFNFHLEDTPFAFVRFWMTKRFFISHPNAFECFTDAALSGAKARRTLILTGVGVSAQVFTKRIHIDFGDGLVAGFLRLMRFQPTKK